MLMMLRSGSICPYVQNLYGIRQLIGCHQQRLRCRYCREECPITPVSNLSIGNVLQSGRGPFAAQ